MFKCFNSIKNKILISRIKLNMFKVVQSQFCDRFTSVFGITTIDRIVGNRINV